MDEGLDALFSPKVKDQVGIRLCLRSQLDSPFALGERGVGANCIYVSFTVHCTCLPAPLGSLQRGKELPQARCHLPTPLLLVCNGLLGRSLKHVWFGNTRDSTAINILHFVYSISFCHRMSANFRKTLAKNKGKFQSA